MNAPLPDDDALWPGQCPTCGGYEHRLPLCRCDAELDADLLPASDAERDWQRLMERIRDWHDD